MGERERERERDASHKHKSLHPDGLWHILSHTKAIVCGHKYDRDPPLVVKAVLEWCEAITVWVVWLLNHQFIK